MSAVVNAETREASELGIGLAVGADSGGDLGIGVVPHFQSGRSVSLLAKQLEPPAKPKVREPRPPTPPSPRSAGTHEGVMIGAVLSLGLCFILTPATLLFLFMSPVVFWVMVKRRVQVEVCGVILSVILYLILAVTFPWGVGLVAGLLALALWLIAMLLRQRVDADEKRIMAVWGSTMKRWEDSVKGWDDPLKRWEEAMKRWDMLFYCPRCDHVYIPQTGHAAPSSDMAALLWQ
ncbi:MAG: hypothetical protein HY321_00245 [Armatimonadetes bacterium]|nr:hypothetical protein [Armatimonadota bacterium]